MRTRSSHPPQPEPAGAARHSRRLAARVLGLLLVAGVLAIAAVAVGTVTSPAPAHAANCEDCPQDDGAGTGGGGGGASTGPVEWSWQPWGGILSLNRDAGCFAGNGIPVAEGLVLATVPQPWGTLAVAGIRLNKAWIAANVGTKGVDLHFNWLGVMHWVEPRGPRQDC